MPKGIEYPRTKRKRASARNSATKKLRSAAEPLAAEEVTARDALPLKVEPWVASTDVVENSVFQSV